MLCYYEGKGVYGMKRWGLSILIILLMVSLSSCTRLPFSKEPPAQPVLSQPPASQPAIPSEPTANPLPPEPPQVDAPINPGPVGSSPGYDWYFRRNSQHTTPGAPAEAGTWLSQYRGFYVLPNNSNRVYLTFDCGYELGYTSAILDTLKQHDVKAAFFITGQYIKTRPDLVLRMHQEGHLVCNHTWNHPDMSTLSATQIEQELRQLEEAYRKLTGSSLDPYLRPPMGRYSEYSLAQTSRLGYSTVFWSLAFKDWDPNQQPGAEVSYREVMNNIHPGAVILLHAVSKSNTEALDKILTDLKAQGYVPALFP